MASASGRLVASCTFRQFMEERSRAELDGLPIFLVRIDSIAVAQRPGERHASNSLATESVLSLNGTRSRTELSRAGQRVDGLSADKRSSLEREKVTQ